MICISIGEYGLEACKKALKKCEKIRRDFPDLVAEMRLDLCGLNPSEVTELFLCSKIPLIVTCRKRSRDLYQPAVLAGAAYADIEVISSRKVITGLFESFRGKNVKKILSYHDYQRTPPINELISIYNQAVEYGADIVKIVTTSNTLDEVERILSMYELHRNGKLAKKVPLIAFSMGNYGAYSRFESNNMGSPLIYCSLLAKNALVPGMPSIDKVREQFSHPKVEGTVSIPTSKSVAQRAIIAAILAKGESRFHNFTRCGDIDAALVVARQLKAKYTMEGDLLSIRGTVLSKEKNKTPFQTTDFNSAIFLQDQISIFVGESGLLSRLCIPLAAQLGESVTITGEGSLLGREMCGCKEALEQFKAKCILTAEDTLPAQVCGPLSGGKVTVSGNKGSQLISGLLMALPLCKKDSEITVVNVTSVPYIMLTVDLIRKFGIDVSFTMDDDTMVFYIPGKQKYSPVEMTLEGDWSSAANFVVAAAIFGDLLLQGLDVASHQADRDVMDIVKGCGAIVEKTPKGIRVHRGHLHPFEYDATHSPDLFPILTVLAAFCEGTSIIKGLNRLKNKECNRTIAICQELGKMGINMELEGDSLIVYGESLSRREMEDNMLKGGDYQSFADHRIAMALKVASLGCREKVHVDNLDCVGKSFPTFLELFASIIKKG